MGQCIAIVKCSRLGSYTKMSVWSWKRNGWLDCVFAVFLLAALLISLSSIGFRTSFSNVPKAISVNGGTYPEIGIFNILLCISSFLGIVCVVLRYVSVTNKNVVLSSVIQILNKLSILPGFASLAGLLIVATFPVNSKQKGLSVHTVGSYIFYTLGLLFFCMQTATTFIYSRFSKIFLIRLVLVIISAGSFIGAVVLTEQNEIDLPQHNSNGTFGNETTAIKTKSTIAFGLEGAFTFVYILFFLTFFIEFQQISTYIIVRPLITSAPNEYSSAWTVSEKV